MPTEIAAELVNLYHLAKVALEGADVHDRMVWAANSYAKEHNVPAIRAYKTLDRALHGYTKFAFEALNLAYGRAGDC